MADIGGPWIVWEDFGYEGWQPKSYPTAEAALTDTHYNRFLLTKVPTITVVEDSGPRLGVLKTS